METILIYISLLLHFISIPTTQHVEVPVFKLNFYLMGMEEVDQSVTVQIGQNIEYLNQEFEGLIKFELGQLTMDRKHVMIPDLHGQFMDGQSTAVNDMVEPIERGKGIHIYLFDTYTKPEDQGPMLGFTPILRANHKDYAQISPEFDRLYVSYSGILDMTTIVHEMGHFLGLSHPWEMTDFNLNMMGLKSDHAERNHMTYHPEVNNFSAEQLERMQHFALTFRMYMVDRVEHHVMAYTSAFGAD